jgi:hypothetical protein
MGEILITAICCFAITLFGLGIGFGFLKLQEKANEEERKPWFQ